MNSLELESWAMTMAARNSHPFDWITPVLLYRDGVASLMGAYTQMEDGKEVVFTAAHGFSIDYPPCSWTFRRLIPDENERRPLAKSVPMRGVDDDAAICTPASLLQVSNSPLPNFYQGLRRSSDPPALEVLEPLAGTARSVLTGKNVRILGEARIGGKLVVGLDYKVEEGQSGSLFVDETEHKMYIVCLHSPSVSQYMRKRMSTGPGAIKHGVAFAIRLVYE